jgi:hypothetical protein
MIAEADGTQAAYISHQCQNRSQPNGSRGTHQKRLVGTQSVRLKWHHEPHARPTELRCFPRNADNMGDGEGGRDTVEFSEVLKDDEDGIL